MGDRRYELHKAVFTNDTLTLKSLLKRGRVDIERRDVHTLTPLLLAAKLGRLECTKVLLEHGADVDSKSEDGWAVLEEAVVFGNREIIELLIRASHERAEKELEMLKPKLKEALCKVPDFSLTLNWELNSWVPFLSRILPSDVCQLHKQGTKLRIDSTLLGFKDLHWVRGKVSFYIECMDLPQVCVVDHNRQLLEHMKPEVTQKNVEENTSALLAKEVVYSHVSTKPIDLQRARAGWLWRSDKEETIAGHPCPVYDVTGVTLIQRRRNEHLSEGDIKVLASIRGQLNSGGVDSAYEDDNEDGDDEDDGADDSKVTFRPSLPPPTTSSSWEEYVESSSTGCPEGVGRQPHISESQRHFKSTVSLSENFPIPRELVLDILELIAPYKHFHKLRSLVGRLPTGFPLQFEVPLYPTVTGKVSVKEYAVSSQSPVSRPADFFRVPRYTCGRVFELR